MTVLIGFIIPLVSFFFQAYPRFFNKYFGVDVWTRLIETDHIRRHHHRIPGKIHHGFIIEGFFDYPPVFPWILSFISKSTLVEIQGFVAPFFDALHCLVIYFVAYQLTNDQGVSLLAQTMYLATPLIALENSYLTPRSFGYLNFTLAIYPLLLYSVSPDSRYLLFAFIFGTLIFLTHRFATQSFFFAILFFSIVDNSWLYLGMFTACFITALTVTRGYYLRVLKGHLYNIYFWINNFDYRFAHQIRGITTGGGQTDFINIIYLFLARATPLALITSNVWLLSAIIFEVATMFHIELLPVANVLYHKMSLWVIFFYVLAIIVLSFKRLIPIGEGQRYIEMAVAPSAILSSIIMLAFINSIHQPFALLLLIALITGNVLFILLVQQKAILKDTNRTLTNDLRNVFGYINGLNERTRIICIPHQITTMTVYHTNADVLVNADNPGLMKLTNVYPILRRPIPALAEKYNLTHLLLRESFATLAELKLSNKKILYRSGDVCLVSLR